MLISLFTINSNFKTAASDHFLKNLILLIPKMPKNYTIKDLESRIDQNGVLDLSMSKISDISFLKKLAKSNLARRITGLDLSDNKLTFNSEHEKSNNNTQFQINSYTIDHKNITEVCPIPENLRNSLTFINFSNNKIENLPSYFALCKNLKKIDLYDNQLKQLNVDVFGNLEKLSWLDITGNETTLNDEAKLLIPRNQDMQEIAEKVSQFYQTKYKTTQKMRLRKKKKQDKINEKIKLQQKEERRKAHQARVAQEKLLQEAQEKLQAEEKVFAGSLVEVSETGSESGVESADESDVTGAKINEKIGSEKSSLWSIIMLPFTLIYKILSFFIGLILFPFKLVYWVG